MFKVWRIPLLVGPQEGDDVKPMACGGYYTPSGPAGDPGPTDKCFYLGQVGSVRSESDGVCRSTEATPLDLTERRLLLGGRPQLDHDQGGRHSRPVGQRKVGD